MMKQSQLDWLGHFSTLFLEIVARLVWLSELLQSFLNATICLIGAVITGNRKINKTLFETVKSMTVILCCIIKKNKKKQHMAKIHESSICPPFMVPVDKLRALKNNFILFHHMHDYSSTNPL